MKRHIAALLLFAALLPALCAPALAADPDYTGPLDPETGEPLDASGERTGGERVLVAGSMYYDWKTHDFAYPVGDTLSEVHANAADGMVLTSPVTLSVNGEAVLTVYKDGREYDGDAGRVDQVGSYSVFAQSGGQSRRILGFTLVGSSTNALHTFTVPDGFYIRETTRDGEPMYADRYSVVMETEGAYAVEYECNATDLVYRLETTIDRTPTYLAFDGRIDGEGRVRSALRFTGMEANDRVYLSRSGENVDVTVDQDGVGIIRDPGTYKLTVVDPAGNPTEYEFIILQYYNLQSWVFFLLVFLSLAAVGVYVFVKRKQLKVA